MCHRMNYVFRMVCIFMPFLSCFPLSGQVATTITVGSAVLEIGAPIIVDSTKQAMPLKYLVTTKKINATTYGVRIRIIPEKAHLISDIDLRITMPVKKPAGMAQLKNAFHWVPNIKNAGGQIIAEHAFRSPCMLLTLQEDVIAFVPDIATMNKNRPAPYYMDLDYGEDAIRINYGLSRYDVVRHQYYVKSGASFLLKDTLDLAFYILRSPGTDPLPALEMVNGFLWRTLAAKHTHSWLPQTVPFRKYAEIAYPMALQHYWVDGPKAGRGGITLSTFYDTVSKKYGGRFYKNDLWYHSWFNNIRTAYGLYAWGEGTGSESWKKKAVSVVRQLLDAPRNGGWFPTIFSTEDDRWVESGQGGGRGLYHMPDNAWTAFWLMRFNEELQRVEGVDQLGLEFAGALLRVQDEDGSFPARVNAGTLMPDSVLRNSASSAMGTWYIAELMLRRKPDRTDWPAYKAAIRRSLDFLTTHVLPHQRFEDFELYFSCSRKPIGFYDSSTYMYAQNTLAIQWCAEAYLSAYRLFKDMEYLRRGEYCLNILSLYQQVWNPPFLNLYALGGFGVMNTDAEWNDARQAQFAETYLNYYYATRKREYLERAVYACRSAFALMVLPQNRDVAPANYRGTDINGEMYPGTMAENYGHTGFDARSFQSGFHWGSGSALTTAAIFHNKLGGVYVDNNLAMGIDGVVVDSVYKRGKRLYLQTRSLLNHDPLIRKDAAVKKKVKVYVENE